MVDLGICDSEHDVRFLTYQIFEGQIFLHNSAAVPKLYEEARVMVYI